jgi:hypothetical protein
VIERPFRIQSFFTVICPPIFSNRGSMTNHQGISRGAFVCSAHLARWLILLLMHDLNMRVQYLPMNYRHLYNLPPPSTFL